MPPTCLMGDIVAVSTYTLAVEAYNEIKPAYDTAGLTPPSDGVTPTYGSMASSARRALRTLNQKKDRTYNETTTVAVEDDDTDDFRNLLVYFTFLPIVTTAAGSATKIKAGPVEISESTYVSMRALFDLFALRVADLVDLPVGNGIAVVALEMDWESSFVTVDEYYR